MPGTLALVGGEEFTAACSFDRDLVSDGGRVLVIPTALAYEDPSGSIERAQGCFKGMGASVEVLDVYRRSEATEESVKDRVAGADLIYVTSGSPMHLRSVLKDTPLLDSLVDAWRSGVTVALSGEAAAVACANMVDSRGGAFTVGLDLISDFTVVPRLNRWSPEKWHRTVELASPGLPIVGIDEATALIRSNEGEWRVEGAGRVHVFVDGSETDTSVLP